MPTAVEHTINALSQVVQNVPIGTNCGLLYLLWAMLNGSFLGSRGAIFPALSQSGFSAEESRRSWAAMRYGSWRIAELLESWQAYVASENRWRARQYGGYRVVSIDTSGFWRWRLKGWIGKHFNSVAQKALPAVVFGIIVAVGEIEGKRIPLPKWFIRRTKGMSATDLEAQILAKAAQGLAINEVAALDGGFQLKAIQTANLQHYVVRGALNFVARRNQLPAYKGRGCRPKYGHKVRPLARRYKDKQIAADPADQQVEFTHQGRLVRAQGWHRLVRSDVKVSPPYL